MAVLAAAATNNGFPFNDPTETLGPPDSSDSQPSPRGLYSLGAFGSIDLLLGVAVVDRPGADLVIWEEESFSDGGAPDESASVLVSADGALFVPVGSIQIGVYASQFIDIAGAGLALIRAVRIVDTSGSGPSPTAGFDLDAVTALFILNCPGDIDHDLDIDFADLNALLSGFNQLGEALPGDFDNDGDVDFADLNTLLGVFNTSCR